MNTFKRWMKHFLLQVVLSGTILLLLATNVSAANGPTPSRGPNLLGEVPAEMLVDVTEAIGLSDYWYGMELNRFAARMTALELADRFNRIGERQVLYLVSGKTLLDDPPSDEPVLAYIIKYQPTGYVIVSGSDRLEPITAFSAEAEFRWDRPDVNFMRYYLGKEIPNRWDYLEARLAAGVEVSPHPLWETLRSRLRSLDKFEDPNFIMAPDAILVEWDTAAWAQGPFYNDVVLTNNGNITGIPTGCTATAMAIKMRFHEWPGSGAGSHAYTDVWGTVLFSHSVNFAAQTYTWANMPVTNLTAANANIANLMYHAGVAVDMDYEVGGSGAWPTPNSMHTFYGYKGTVELTSGHDNPVRDSILGGLPVILSSSAHTVIADGYRDTVAPYYHINAGWGGGGDGWFSFSTIPGSDPTLDRSYPYSAPSNYFYVDLNWTGSENGNLQNPFNTWSEGLSHTPTRGHLWLKAGSYPGAVSITQAMTIHSYQGTATVGE